MSKHVVILRKAILAFTCGWNKKYKIKDKQIKGEQITLISLQWGGGRRFGWWKLKLMTIWQNITSEWVEYYIDLHSLTKHKDR